MRTKLPALLGLSNVVLLVSSTALVYLGSSLITFYLLDKLDFVSAYFSAAPWAMVATGAATFVIALYGCFAAAGSSRFHLSLYAGLMALLFALQLGGIFAAMELRGAVVRRELQTVDVLTSLEDYGANPATRRRWDALHQEFGCCGGINFNDGYKIWRNSDIGRDENAVPDSCCLEPSPGCGRHLLTESDVTVHRRIHVHGCLTAVRRKLEDQVVPVLLGFAATGTALALLQLLAVVFALSYSAALGRYQKQADEARSFRSAVPNHSAPNTPKFDHIRGGHRHHGHYGQDNISTVFNDEQHLYGDMDIDGVSTLGSRHGKIIRGYSDSQQDAIRPASQLKEREV